MKQQKINNIVLKKGLNVDVIKKISSLKHEPKWMLDIRLNAYDIFKQLKNPKWGPKLDFIDFNDYIYYASSIGSEFYKTSWNEVPSKIKKQFDELNIPENEAKYFSGVNNQYDSETIHHQLKKKLDEAIRSSLIILKNSINSKTNINDLPPQYPPYAPVIMPMPIPNQYNPPYMWNTGIYKNNGFNNNYKPRFNNKGYQHRGRGGHRGGYYKNNYQKKKNNDKKNEGRKRISRR